MTFCISSNDLFTFYYHFWGQKDFEDGYRCTGWSGCIKLWQMLITFGCSRVKVYDIRYLIRIDLGNNRFNISLLSYKYLVRYLLSLYIHVYAIPFTDCPSTVTDTGCNLMKYLSYITRRAAASVIDTLFI